MENLKNKIVNFASKCKKKVVALATSVSALALTSIPAFAEEAGTIMNSAAIETEMQNFANTLTGYVNFGNVVAIIGIGLSISIAPVLGWWGGRKLLSMFKSSVLKGKVRI